MKKITKELIKKAEEEAKKDIEYEISASFDFIYNTIGMSEAKKLYLSDCKHIEDFIGVYGIKPNDIVYNTIHHISLQYGGADKSDEYNTIYESINKEGVKSYANAEYKKNISEFKENIPNLKFSVEGKIYTQFEEDMLGVSYLDSLFLDSIYQKTALYNVFKDNTVELYESFKEPINKVVGMGEAYLHLSCAIPTRELVNIDNNKVTKPIKVTNYTLSLISNQDKEINLVLDSKPGMLSIDNMNNLIYKIDTSKPLGIDGLLQVV